MVRKVSSAVIARLPRYYRFLTDLQLEGTERISSEELSRIMGVTASQIRQDLNHFGGFGQQGYGYNVSHLRNEIGRILGLDKRHNMIIVGGGNLGRALAGYANFATRGFDVLGVFDRDPAVVGTAVRGIVIRPMEGLEDFIRQNDIAIVALTVPRDSVHELAIRAYRAGIRAFWNFAHIDLDLPGDAVVQNVHLSESLMQLSYMLNSSPQKRESHENTSGQ